MKKIKFTVLALVGLLVLSCQEDEPIPVENEVSRFFLTGKVRNQKVLL